MKKVISSALILLLSVIVITGCGSGLNNTKKSNSSSLSTSKAEEVAIQNFANENHMENYVAINQSLFGVYTINAQDKIQNKDIIFIAYIHDVTRNGSNIILECEDILQYTKYKISCDQSEYDNLKLNENSISKEFLVAAHVENTYKPDFTIDPSGNDSDGYNLDLDFSDYIVVKGTLLHIKEYKGS